MGNGSGEAGLIPDSKNSLSRDFVLLQLDMYLNWKFSVEVCKRVVVLKGALFGFRKTLSLSKSQ